MNILMQLGPCVKNNNRHGKQVDGASDSAGGYGDGANVNIHWKRH